MTAFDGNDNVVKQIDPLGNATESEYDALNRKVSSTDARGGVVTLAYDFNDNLLSLVDPVGNQTRWLYDALNRKVFELDPNGFGAVFAYNALNRLTSAIAWLPCASRAWPPT